MGCAQGLTEVYPRPAAPPTAFGGPPSPFRGGMALFTNGKTTDLAG